MCDRMKYYYYIFTKIMYKYLKYYKLECFKLFILVSILYVAVLKWITNYL